MKRKKIYGVGIFAIMLFLTGCSKSIDIEEARNIVLKEAGLSMNDVTFTSEKSDEDGFEFHFQTDEKKYRYEMNKNGKTDEMTSVPLSNLNQDVPQSNVSQEINSSENPSDERLTKVQALKRVVEYFDVDQNHLSRLEIYQEMDDMKEVYEIEFRYEDKEYSAEVDVLTGDLLSTEIDNIH